MVVHCIVLKGPKTSGLRKPGSSGLLKPKASMGVPSVQSKLMTSTPKPGSARSVATPNVSVLNTSHDSTASGASRTGKISLWHMHKYLYTPTFVDTSS